MAYQINVEIELKNTKRSRIAPEEVHRLLKATTNLTGDQIKRHLETLFNNGSIVVIPKDYADIPAVFEKVEFLQQSGLHAKVLYNVLGLDLPFLIDENGKVEGTEPSSVQDLMDSESVEQALPDAQMIITGYGYAMEWLSEREKWVRWTTVIRPEYERVYFGYEWLTQDQRRFVLIWHSH
jgi:hypothetical protein